MTEQRVVQTINMVAIAVEVTREAASLVTDRCPIASMADILAHDELEVLTVFDVRIQNSSSWCTAWHGEVVELLELSSTIGCISDIYLTVTLNARIVHVVVMLGICKHLSQVVVVSHTHLNGVRICLTKVCLSVVCQIESMLIPVKWVSSRSVLNTVDVTLSITLLLKEFPSTTSHFVCSRSYVWFTNTDVGSRQYNLWSLDVLYVRNTTLEHDVDVHHVALSDRSNGRTR